MASIRNISNSRENGDLAETTDCRNTCSVHSNDFATVKHGKKTEIKQKPREVLERIPPTVP